MRSFVTIALAPTSCSGPTAGATQQERLYFWFPDLDDYAATHIDPGERPISVTEVDEALRACGSTDIEIEFNDLAGEAVSFPSSPKGVLVVNFIRTRVTFGFNTSREQSSRSREGERRKLLFNPDGS